MGLRLSHREILGITESRIKFLTRAMYDLLLTLANKNKWYGEGNRCNLCNERGTLNHILVGCKTTLSQGRYTWRHNKVLQELFERLKEKLKPETTIHKKTICITFVKEGEKTEVRKHTSARHD